MFSIHSDRLHSLRGPRPVLLGACRARVLRIPSKSKRRVVGATAREIPVPVESAEFRSFVGSFRQASPYIVQHAESLFVVVIPGEVIVEEALFYSLLEDLRLLHSLGIHLVVVMGSRCLIDNHLQERKLGAKFCHKLRITDAAALEAAIHVASEVRMKAEGFFSRARSVPLIRRHGSKESSVGTRVVSGNFTAAKPRGIVNGVDFECTGDVRFVSCQPILDMLKQRSIVLLNNLGYSASGSVLNCNTFDVGFHTAVQLKADKIICFHLEDIRQLKLPKWLPLDKAFDLLPADSTAFIRSQTNAQISSAQNGSTAAQPGENRLMWDFDQADRAELPSALVTSILCCHHGVRRSHLVDATVDGGLLLELYTPDGIGTMISSDFHEGIRPAHPGDIIYIEQLLKPLMQSDVIVQRSYEDLLQEVSNFRVFEKERRVQGCALVKILDEEKRIAELGALCMHPDYQGQGRGDDLLTYIEEELLEKDVERLVISTTRTASWFVQRGFIAEGPTHLSSLLPEQRLARIDMRRNAQLYVKTLHKQ